MIVQILKSAVIILFIDHLKRDPQILWTVQHRRIRNDIKLFLIYIYFHTIFIIVED